MNKLVICGIGTGVGKTVASAIFCRALSADYWKPIQSGDLDHSDAAHIGKWVDFQGFRVFPEAYRLKTPASPHHSAQLEGISIETEKLVFPKSKKPLIIEPAGGLMVPLSNKVLFIDWIRETNLPVVLVSNYYLGSINHTLLSVELLKAKGISIKGLVMNGERVDSTFEAITRFSGLPCLLEVGQEDEINEKIISKYANRLNFH